MTAEPSWCAALLTAGQQFQPEYSTSDDTIMFFYLCICVFVYLYFSHDYTTPLVVGFPEVTQVEGFVYSER